MKIQTAIDRVSIEEMLRISHCVYGLTDIVEVGTSLIKDYGINASVGVLRQHLPDMTILADIKTCDEGAYEFRKAYEAGADIATVMGFSADATIGACAETAAEFGKEYFIDLMGLSNEHIKHLSQTFPDAIFSIHLPSDLHGDGLEKLVREKLGFLGNVHAVAAAGGIQLSNIPFLKSAAIDITVIGGAVTKAEDIHNAIGEFVRAAAS